MATVTPYITPAMLHNAPTGVPWSMVPIPRATDAQKLAEQTNVCWRATGEVDRICNQPLRATVDVEEETGPEYRLTLGNNGVATMLVSRWPVVQVLGGQVSPAAALPPSWTSIPASAMRARPQIISAYGSSVPGAAAAGPAEIDIAPGYVNGWGGRNGARVQVGYVNGWPHTSLTAEANAGALTLEVDDVTAFAGASAFVYDDASTEAVSIASVTANTTVTLFSETTPVTVPTGPGTITLSSATAFQHAAGILVSAMPQDVTWATALLAASEVLDSGATSMQMKSTSGGKSSSSNGIDMLRKQAKSILSAYARTI